MSLKRSLRILSQRFDFVIVEGVGGILVPFNKNSLIIDIVKDAGLPVLLVTQNKLGTINHILLTVEALKQRKMRILGILFNNCTKEDKRILEDNPRIVKLFSREEVFGVLPRITKYDRLYETFRPMAQRIWKRITGLRKI